MAVAPLFLLPFAGEQTAATVTLWLSLFGFIWVLMEPSRRRGEMAHEARARVAMSVMMDPLFWFSLVLLAYGGIRVLNSGIGLEYDAELMAWSLRTPLFPLLPAGVSGTGYLAFATLVSLVVIFQGTRHAMGRSARVAFALVCALASAMIAFASAIGLSYRATSIMHLISCSTLSASYYGTVFGLQILCSLVALYDVVANRWARAEPVAALALIGNVIGLVLFAPVHTVVVFAALMLVMVICLFILARHVFEGSGSLRCALAILMSLAGGVMYALSTAEAPFMEAKIAAIKGLKFFPDGFFDLRNALSAISLKTWKGSPWLGTGLGSFPLDIRFMANASDWTIISPLQQTTLNGWWQLLVERGVIGACMIAVALGMLLWTYFARMIRGFRRLEFRPVHLVGPLCIVALVALAFVDCSFLRPEVLLVAGALLSLSGGAFPVRVKSEREAKER